ncbi:RCC1 domain protein [Trachipleistophora hominis]|uniref:RCC1 domain protein n=1 Tax=Trachipleistophora hominis TaxID=72359 RepID=L7JUN4_TRAHO|nr:RCC1 domain protein [Trachipleistophora hominis]
MPVYTFGSNLLSQLGTGDEPGSSSTPLELPAFTDLKVDKACCGSLHTLILAEGSVYSFGCNDEFALGREGDENVPIRVQLPERITHIGAGQSASFCIGSSGKLYGWGTFRDKGGVIGFKPNKKFQKVPVVLHRGPVRQLAVGSNHVLYNVRGEVYAIGANEFGEKGVHRNTRMARCRELGAVLVANRRSMFSKCGRMFCGAGTSFMVSERGDAFAFGQNANAQLGLGNTHGGISKRKVPLDDVQSISSGELHTLFVTRNNALYAVGHNMFGQLGTGDNADRHVLTRIDLPNVRTASTKGFFSVAYTDDGMYSWGFNSHGECGYAGQDSSAPKRMETQFDDVVCFDVGHDFCVVVTK